ncbi:hypothetical protein TcWFU_003858 [Taenia crassiceps]|uniref:Uncharacterized protein n=1 Tax=Taenia crassiceps TaxID=6207 RepID=A0ABR4QQF5_9CEST
MSLFPKLKPICDDRGVRDHMNTWFDNYLQKNNSKCALKGQTDPPTVGYGGHIPKAVAANLSFGCTYNKGTRKSLSTFRSEILSHFARLNTPVEPLKKQPERIIPQVFDLSEQPISFRIFRNSGMVPNYAGHVHGQAFTDGRTQGDVTRNLEVCSHHYPSYGSYLKNKDLAQQYCATENA